MKIPIIKTKYFTLRPFRKGDEKSLAKNINDKKIFRNISQIPYPYTLRDAKNWIKKNLIETKKKNPGMVNFVIDIDYDVAGAIGLANIIPNHKAEIGYWLARKYWGRHIITTAVKEVTEFGFKKLKLRRVYAYPFSWNKASMKVLQNADYAFEGILRKNYKKDGKLIDAHLFAKIS